MPIDSPSPSLSGFRLDWRRPEQPPAASKFFAANYAVRTDLPGQYDLRKNCPAVYHQAQEGSCVSNTWAFLCEYRQYTKKAPAVTVSGDKYDQFLDLCGLPGHHPKPQPTPVDPIVMPSRNFIYWNCRRHDGTLNQDAGTSIQEGGEVVSTIGYCGESSWPYGPQTLFKEPPQALFDEAKRYIVPKPVPVHLSSLDSVKTCIAEGRPIAFGFDVYSSFESVGADGNYSPRGRYEGGHAVALVGYDDAARKVTVRNSWGKSWGDGGYFYASYDWLESQQCTDAWTIVG